MSLPSLFLAFLVASLLGALYHLWRGGGPKHILFYLVLAWLGFFAGHFLASWKSWYIYPIGALNLGFAILGALIFLFVGDWLGKIED
ncbi:MAG: hypothetical protein HN390_07075 [Anaerolineae bacterium]|jgi:hypothetical protein|nr:hypothetical protein [Anaerolineae bacterium]MBT7189383.1 hypothetical protein [Anaerolineae bacterium]MBT7991704.1 hypothetical protein [Anaerolineae bacterium]